MLLQHRWDSSRKCDEEAKNKNLAKTNYDI